MGSVVAIPEVGLRERQKRDRLRRIKKAARALFIEKGYDDTTTREIARRADVGLGTLFRYAEDKRDLLFLIFNDDHVTITRDAFAEANERLSFLEQLVEAFRPYYAYFARQPTLARFLLREMTFYMSGKQARQINEGRERILDGLCELVSNARRGGRIFCDEDDRMVAQFIFDIYQAECRRWLLDDGPKVDAGLDVMRRALRIMIKGLNPGPGAL